MVKWAGVDKSTAWMPGTSSKLAQQKTFPVCEDLKDSGAGG